MRVIFCLLSFSLLQIAAWSQLNVSDNLVNAGSLGGKNNQAVIRICNSCNCDLNVLAANSNGLLNAEVPGKVKQGACAPVRISAGGNGSGKARQVLLLKAGEKNAEVIVTARITKQSQTGCYDFGKGKIRGRRPEKQAGQTRIVRTIEVKNGEKNLAGTGNSKAGTHLIALLDASGSMGMMEKLEHSKKSLISVITTLQPADRVSVILYSETPEAVAMEVAASDAGLPDLVHSIKAGGFTNGGRGIASAIEYTREHSIKGRQNHIVLFTDGEFNLGPAQVEVEKFLRGQGRAGDFTFSVVSGGGDRRLERNMRSLAKNGGGVYCDYHDARYHETLVNLNSN